VSADATCENSVLPAELLGADRPPGVRPGSDPKPPMGTARADWLAGRNGPFFDYEA